MQSERPNFSKDAANLAGRLMFQEFSKTASHPNIVRAVQEASQNKEPFMDRVKEFHEVCLEFNNLIGSRMMPPYDKYYRVGFVRNILERKPFPLPSELILSKDKQVRTTAQYAFQEVSQKIAEQEWKFPTEESDPNVIASGLLIEGYGLFLARYYGDPVLARQFVLGFEEVLWNEFPNSKMLGDVKPWMLEDKKYFSKEVRQGLAEIDPMEQDGRRKKQVLSRSPFLLAFTDETQEPSQAQQLREAESNVLRRHMSEELGNNWENKLLSGVRADSEAAEFFKDHISQDIRDGILLSLLLMGYEIGNKNDSELFIGDIHQILRKHLNEHFIFEEDLQAKKTIQSILLRGVMLREGVRMERNRKAAGQIPSVFRKFIESELSVLDSLSE